jgi:autotransporter-associated beta strand protein
LQLEGNGVAGNTTRTLAVADATSSAAADLVISNSLQNAFVSGNVTNLEKTGVGTMLLSGNNTYTGTTTVSAGTLLINGNSTAATGALSVSVGATLGGNGTIGGATTVLGNLQPGNSPGVLTFTNGLTLGSSSTTTMEITGIGAGQFDRALVTGLLTFGGTLALNSSGYTAVFGNSVDLFNWSTTSGTFSAITGTDLGGGLSWDTSSLYTDGVITVVPEPATWALLAAGLTVTMVLRRRRS